MTCQGPPARGPAIRSEQGADLGCLLDVLERQRGALGWKCEGLTGGQLRATLGPSAVTLGGLLKHLARVEDDMLSVRLLGEPPRSPWGEVDWGWDWRTAADDAPGELLNLWQDAVCRSRTNVSEVLTSGEADHELAYMESNGRTSNLRGLLVHLIEEYARHLGHADLIRESIDGRVGEYPPDQSE